MYTANLMDCRGISQSDRDAAVETFCAAVDDALGGTDAATSAYRAYQQIFQKYEEIPLPPEATPEERAAIERWENAERAGERAAFAGWRNVGGAHFEITL